MCCYLVSCQSLFFLRGSLIETIIIILLCSHPTVDLSPSIPVLYSHLWCYDSTHCVHVNDQSRPINNRKWVLFVIVSSLFILVPLCWVESPIIKVFKVTETIRVQNSDPLFVRSERCSLYLEFIINAKWITNSQMIAKIKMIFFLLTSISSNFRRTALLTLE